MDLIPPQLNLPSEIVPATLKKSAKPPSRPFGSGPPGDRPSQSNQTFDKSRRKHHHLLHNHRKERNLNRGPPRFEGDRPRFGDRDGYRGGPHPEGGYGDKGGAPAVFQPSFRGAGGRPAFGRGGGGFGAGPASSLE